MIITVGKLSNSANVLFAHLCFQRSVKKHYVAEISLAISEISLYRVTSIKIPINLVTNSLLTICFPFIKTKNKLNFSASWWSGNEKYFCLLFTASRALLQRHAEFNRL